MIRHDVTNTMRGETLSIYLRTPFDSPVTKFDRLVLGMKFDDGFAAYLNGQMVTGVNTPPQLDWRASAPSKINDSMAKQWQAFPIAPQTLKSKGNVLAIHGLNESLTSSDFLIIPGLVGRKFEGGTIVANNQSRWRRIVARVQTPDGKWSPPGRYDPNAETNDAAMFR